MRRTVLALLLLVAGCNARTRLKPVEGGIQPPPQELSFGTTYRGYPRVKKLTLTNTAPTAREVTFTLQGPFYIDTFSVSVPGAGEGGSTLTFQPDFVGKAQGSLLVQTEGKSWTVQLDGLAADAPICPASTACVPVHFDPDSGKCVSDHLADGTPCADNCLDNATCQAGQCVGAPKNCDDGNVCTTDSCDPAVGCVHQDQSSSCPAPGDNCHAAFCDAKTGCGIRTLDDGTLCGDANCVSKHACEAGVCSVRPTEDGFVCAPSSPCQPEGRCVSHVCKQPQVRTLQPVWTFPLDASQRPTASSLVEDEHDNAFISWSSGDQGALAKVDRAGTVSLLQRGAPAVPLASVGGGVLAQRGEELLSLDGDGAPRFDVALPDVRTLAAQDGVALASRLANAPQPWTPDATAFSLSDGSISWVVAGAHAGGGATLGRAIGDGQGHFFITLHGPDGDVLRALDGSGQELWRANIQGEPTLAVNGLVLTTDGVARATSDGHVLFDTGAPVATGAGDPVSDGTHLWIPRGDGKQVTGLDVWDIGSGQQVGSVSDASRFSGLRQLTATSNGTVIAEDGASLVQLDAQANLVWSCPVPGAPLYAPGPSGRPPEPLLEPGTFVRLAELPQDSRAPVPNVSGTWQLQGFWFPGMAPASSGWVTGQGSGARTQTPK